VSRQQTLHLYEFRDDRNAVALLQIRKDEWPIAAHSPCIGIHHFQGRFRRKQHTGFPRACARTTPSELFKMLTQSQALALIV
jgi:hypothetical protein